MILKHIVPKDEKHRYNNKKIIYCEVLDVLKITGEQKIFVYKVKMINNQNRVSIFTSEELRKINLLDKIKNIKYFLKKEN